MYENHILRVHMRCRYVHVLTLLSTKIRVFATLLLYLPTRGRHRHLRVPIMFPVSGVLGYI